MNVLNIHQKDEQYSHPYSKQVRLNSGGQGLKVEATQGLAAARVRVWRRLRLGFGGGQGQGLVAAGVMVWWRLGLGGGQVRVKWQLVQGQELVYNGVVLSSLSFCPFMVFECTQNLQALLVVANHSFFIVAFETYNLCNLLIN